MRGIHRWPVNSPHKWPVTGKMYPYDYVIIWRDRSVITYPYNCYWKIWQNIPQPYYISCSKTYNIFVVSFGLLLVRDGPLGATLGQDVLTVKEILNILCLNCYSMLFLLLATARVLLYFVVAISKLIEAKWCIYASVNWAIIGSDSGLWSDRCQTNIRINAGI